MKVKIISWNIWCDGYLEKVKKFLEEESADVICLQEVIEDQDPNISGFLKQLGYTYVYADSMEIRLKSGKQVWMGNAIYSKPPILKSKIWTLSKEDKRIALQADIQINNQIFHVFCTHLTHAHLKPDQRREEQMDHLLKVLPKEKVIVAGDFNTIPESIEIQKISQVLRNTDLTKAPTWTVYIEGCPECNTKLYSHRLDNIFVSTDIKVISSQVGKSKGSDHLPVIAVIET